MAWGGAGRGLATTKQACLHGAAMAAQGWEQRRWRKGRRRVWGAGGEPSLGSFVVESSLNSLIWTCKEKNITCSFHVKLLPLPMLW
jgi:hypothetical protein